MSDMKCPFCQQEYIITKDDSCFGQQRCVCRNPNCEFDGWHFPIKLVSELIRTSKALDILLFTINRLENQNYKDCAWHLRLARAKIEAMGIANKALEQITALEQKDVK